MKNKKFRKFFKFFDKINMKKIKINLLILIELKVRQNNYNIVYLIYSTIL